MILSHLMPGVFFWRMQMSRMVELDPAALAFSQSKEITAYICKGHLYLLL